MRYGAVGALGDAAGIPIIEDCCHSFGSKIDGRLCGTFGVFAFMSGQWNKPSRPAWAACCWSTTRRLADRVGQIIDTEAFAPGPLKNAILSAQILAHKLLVRPATAIAVMLLYRA